MRFIITRHPGIEAVFLSRPGVFGNLPFANSEAATAHARELAGSDPVVTIETETAKPRRRRIS